MNIFRSLSTEMIRIICFLIISLIISMGFISSVQASMVSTQDLVTASTTEQSRENIRIALQRLEVQEQLTQFGVTPDLVLSRVDSMTDSEIQELSGLIDQKPAGSGVIGLLGFVLVVLLITDLLKLTNVYNL